MIAAGSTSIVSFAISQSYSLPIIRNFFGICGNIYDIYGITVCILRQIPFFNISVCTYLGTPTSTIIISSKLWNLGPLIEQFHIGAAQ